MKANRTTHREVCETRALTTHTRLHYPGSSLTVTLDDAPEIDRALRQALRGWCPNDMPAEQDASPQSKVRREKAGYTTQSIYLDETLRGLGVAAATCAVIADLAQDFFETRPGCMALHCGAFRYNGRLIAMTGPSRAGKSTLTARLTAEPDMEIFCDDILPLIDGEAFALGIAPRLRLPLPATCTDAFRTHVAANLGPHDDRYGYVCTPTVATHGTRAELSVLLILDRRAEGRARLHSVKEGEALKYLLSQNMSDLVSADAAFARLSEFLEKVICLRLVYADLEDAVVLLREAFGGNDVVAPGTVIHPSICNQMDDRLPAVQTDPTLRWMRDSDIMLQTKADTTFLWKVGTQTIWHMNSQAYAIWTMLEIPGSATDIGKLLASHFPGEDEERVIADVNALLHALAGAGMIVPAA